MIVSAVLRRSISFRPEHVEWLGRQVARVYPEAEFRPFSDTPLAVPHERLETALPAWWAKMEAMRRLTQDTVLMLDLDTVLVRPIDIPIPPPGRAYMQASPRDITKLWGGLQISSPEFRAAVTEHFFADPEGALRDSEGCDQRYYGAHWRSRISVLNAVRPDAAVSYKIHVLHDGVAPENAFVMFHAHPRPWDVSLDWVPPLFPPSE